MCECRSRAVLVPLNYIGTFENDHAVYTYLAVLSTLRLTYDWILVILVAMYSQGYENVL